MAAHEKLRKLTGQANVECSIKYQVLSKETAMVGVVKQKKKATGELLEYTIQMGKSVTSEGLYEEERMMQTKSIGGLFNHIQYGASNALFSAMPR